MPNNLPTVDIPSCELSRVIGLVYDCAIDPTLWPKALQAMCGLIGARLGSIAIHDTTLRQVRYATFWGDSPDAAQWIRLYEERYAPLMPFHDVMGAFRVGEAANTAMIMRVAGRNDFYDSEFYREWGRPAGLKDVVTIIVERSDTRVCVFGMHTPLDVDLVGPRELAIGELMAPHVRRAVLIGDLLEMRRIEGESLSEALELLAAAVILIDGRGGILHANAAARAMLDAGDPITIRSDCLAIREKAGDRALARAIERAAGDEVALGASGIAVPVPFADGRPAVAHVLPLTTSHMRSKLAPAATAAVFVSAPGVPVPPVEAIAALYDLTLAESRVLESIVAGRNQAETADHLGVAESTVKTHLGRIFSKTGTASQSELASLAHGLASPATRANSRRD